jgi:hypothetical protein
MKLVVSETPIKPAITNSFILRVKFTDSNWDKVTALEFSPQTYRANKPNSHLGDSLLKQIIKAFHDFFRFPLSKQYRILEFLSHWIHKQYLNVNTSCIIGLPYDDGANRWMQPISYTVTWVDEKGIEYPVDIKHDEEGE